MNKEKYNEYMRSWYAKNKDRVNSIRRDKYSINKEPILAVGG